MSTIGYRRVIRTLRKKAEMSTLERLKTLYKERYFEHHDIDEWNEAIEKEWPKILAVVEAAKSIDWIPQDLIDHPLWVALDALDES